MVTSFITDFGDAGFLLPASAIVAVYLLTTQSKGAAATWLSAIVLCAGLTLWAKLVSLACGPQLLGWGIQSPSGHASLSTTFYASGALILSVNRERWARIALLIGGALIILAIAVTRVRLGAHTLPEVISGIAIGLVCVAWFGSQYLSASRVMLRWVWLVPALVVLALLTHGRHVTIENRIAALIDRIQLAGFSRVMICTPDKEWVAALEAARHPHPVTVDRN